MTETEFKLEIAMMLFQADRLTIEAVKPLLDNLIDTAKFRVSQRLYSLVLQTVGE